LTRDELEIVVQVNGKLRSRFNTGADTDDDALKRKALADERVKKFIEGRPVKKVIVVKKKLVNVVI
jgi:leucyl-tRNA synthetase